MVESGFDKVKTMKLLPTIKKYLPHGLLIVLILFNLYLYRSEFKVLSDPNDNTFHFALIDDANNIWKEVIQKMGKPKVLYISEPRKKLDRAVPQIVKSSAYFEFDTIRSSKPIDRFLYDVIILDDIPMIDEIVPII